MKKTKRIVAFVLVLAFVFAFMAMNASAATARGATCVNCGDANTQTSATWTKTESVYVSSCDRINGSHYHIRRTPVKTFKCNECRYTFDYVVGNSTVTCG